MPQNTVIVLNLKDFPTNERVVKTLASSGFPTTGFTFTYSLHLFPPGIKYGVYRVRVEYDRPVNGSVEIEDSIAMTDSVRT